MAVVTGEAKTVLPLPYGGIMSDAPYPEVNDRLRQIEREAASLGAIEDPFMYLSFLALTVIPELRLTERGLFDQRIFSDIDLFLID
ncbi:hypothetical protein RJ53_09740 [Methanocalculus chunghsingensis]|uniref:Adenine deaminase C-terminal domain-containing protein n=2 Tax=Methanocalculus chunghsingensis TaxID=156457 RepID=A0A8J7WB75_9EURY|nr:hypothetical protein [Methanocalculus chunghsingensis]